MTGATVTVLKHRNTNATAAYNLVPNWLDTTSSTSTFTNSAITASTLTASNLVLYNDLDRNFPLSVDNDFSGEIKLPDGSILKFDRGNYTIEDKDSKITYRANRIRDFNKYLAGSDLLEEFIKYLVSLNISKQEAMAMSIENFIMWLIISAAEKDREERPHNEILMLETTVKSLKKKARCKCCGRFLKNFMKTAGIEFCSGSHMDRWLAKAT